MKECLKVQRLLSRYIDNEAGGKEKSLIEAHLKSCALCAEEFSRFSGIKKIISERQRKSLPEDYLVSMLRQEIALEEREAAEHSWINSLGGLSRKLLPVPVGVIVLSSLFLMLVSSREAQYSSLEEDLLSGKPVTVERVSQVVLETQA